MKNFYTFILAVFMLMQTSVFAQKTASSFLIDATNKHEKVSEITKNLKDYTLFSLDERAVYDFLKNENHLLTVNMGNEKVTVKVNKNDLVGNDYQLIVADDNGQRVEKSTLRTYDGHIEGKSNNLVAVTSNSNFFSLMFEKNGTSYYIEPADFMSKSTKGFYIMYKNTDYIGEKFACAHEDIEEANHAIEDAARGVGPCLRVEWGIASDNSMYVKYGNSVPNVEARVVSVYNLSQINYKNAFNNDFEFKMVKQIVGTTANAISVSNSTDINTVLTSFNAWVDAGNLNFNNGKPDMASFWSNRDYDGSAIGLAYLKAVCGNARTQVIQDYAATADAVRAVVAHETGHNFDMAHDATGAPYIMAPAANPSQEFSAASKSALNAYIATVLASGAGNCLSSCSVPGQAPTANFFSTTTGICIGKTVTFFDDSTNDPTSFGWTFQGGTPATSTLEDVTVTYNTIGKFDVSHTATNANGTNSITKKTYIRADTVKTGYCNFPGTSTSTGGLKQFNIATFADQNTYLFSATSGNSASEGKYKDNSCTRIATLEAFKDYAFSVEIGDASSSPGIIEFFKIWIDYNNNGVLNDAGELVSFSSGGYAGLVTLNSGLNVSTLKVKTPLTPVFDKLLRCRIMVSTKSIPSNPCYNTLADISQVEDFSIIIQSPFTATETVTNVKCKGGATGEIKLNLQGGAAPFVYTWNNPIATGDNPKNLTAGTYNVTVTEAGGNKVERSIVVGEPTAVLSATPTVINANCGNPNGSITMAAAGGNGGYSYKWSNIAKDTSVNGNIIGGTYLLTVTDAKGCAVNSSITVTTTPGVPLTFTGNKTICPSTSITITASGASTYAWSNGGTAATLTVSPAKTTAYYITATGNNCTKTDSVVINVQQVVAAITAPKDTICEGESLTLTATGGGTYLWSNNLKTADNNVKPTKTTAYNVTVTVNGCTAAATKNVIVNTVTGTITSSNAKPCAGETFSLTATGGGKYVWADGNTNDKINVSTNGPATFTVTVTGTNGCVKAFSTTVQGVPPLPKPIISVLGVAKFCEGGNAILSSTTGPAGTQYVWSNSTVTTQSITVTKTGDYTVKLKNGTCESATSEITKIEVLPPPPVPTITKAGTGSTLTSSSTTGNLWFFSATQNGVYTALGGAINPTYKVIKNGYYYVQVTDANGCSSKSTALFINITGVEETLSNAQFNVFPNPTDDKLTVTLQDVPTTVSKFVVTNVVGQVIYTQAINATTISSVIDVNNWAKGTYFISVLNARNEAISVRKVVKVD